MKSVRFASKDDAVSASFGLFILSQEFDRYNEKESTTQYLSKMLGLQDCIQDSASFDFSLSTTSESTEDGCQIRLIPDDPKEFAKEFTDEILLDFDNRFKYTHEDVNAITQGKVVKEKLDEFVHGVNSFINGLEMEEKINFLNSHMDAYTKSASNSINNLIRTDDKLLRPKDSSNESSGFGKINKILNDDIKRTFSMRIEYEDIAETSSSYELLPMVKTITFRFYR